MTVATMGGNSHSYTGTQSEPSLARRPAATSAPALEDFLVGDSVAMHGVRALVRRLAPTDIPVIIFGPTGAGKDLVAQALHAHSGREGAFVAANVCAIADGMFEDALFGHVRGAFTGATHDSAGYLVEANGGTMFLDEIAGLSFPSQAKLLRAIENQKFRPVGGRKDRASQFRVVVATNEDLNRLASRGQFRMDLLHRLQGAVIDVPPLDHRPEDIAPLAQLFASRRSGAERQVITSEGLAVLRESSWTGNVRELMLVVQCAGVFAERGTIDREAVMQAIAIRSQGSRLTRPAGARAELVADLVESKWDVTAVARRRGLHRATIYRQMRRLCIRSPVGEVNQRLARDRVAGG